MKFYFSLLQHLLALKFRCFKFLNYINTFTVFIGYNIVNLLFILKIKVLQQKQCINLKQLLKV